MVFLKKDSQALQPFFPSFASQGAAVGAAGREMSAVIDTGGRMRLQYRIRPIQSRDNQTVFSLIQEVLPVFGLQGEGCAAADPEAASMYEAYQGPGKAYFIAESTEPEGAAASCRPTFFGGSGIAPLNGGPDKTCELQKCYLYEAYRGHGIGQALIVKCLELAREYGYTHCYLETFYTMEAARGLYQRLGFRYLPSPLGNTGHTQCTHWMIKAL
jgi:putative acetyltransferase